MTNNNIDDAHKDVPPADFFRYDEGFVAGILPFNDIDSTRDKIVAQNNDGALEMLGAPF